MFKKLVSNLPYSPGLLSQVGFYARRLSQDNVLRRLGLLFAGLSIVLQTVIFIAPPAPSLAGSGNDLVDGGLRNNSGQDLSESAAKAKMIDYVYTTKGDTNGLKALFNHYGVTKSMVQNSDEVWVCSRQGDRTAFGTNCNDPKWKNMRSVGRKSKSAQDVRINLAGGEGPFYHRPLSVFDSSGVSMYKALEIVPNEVYILYSCGNLAFTNIPQPNVTTSKTIVDKKSSVPPGTNVTYKLTASNTSDVTANEVVVKDVLDADTQYVSDNGSQASVQKFTKDGQNRERVVWNIGSLAAGKSFTLNITVKIIETTETDQVCNVANLSYDNGNGGDAKKISNKVCQPVEDTPNPPPPPPPPPQPIAECSAIATSGLPEDGDVLVGQRAIFAAVLGESTANPERFIFKVNDEVFVRTTNELSYTFDQANEYLISVSVEFDNGTTTEHQTCQVNVRVKNQPEEETDSAKSARVVANLENLEPIQSDPRTSNADGSTVSSNEFIEYAVSVENTGSIDITNYQFPSDDITDVLEYADVIAADGARVSTTYTDTEEIALYGGGSLSEGVVSWPTEDTLSINETVTRTFYVQVKSEIPTTNTPPSDQLSYDCSMRNVFDVTNQIDIDVKCAIEKQLENPELPKTGPAEVAVLTGSMSFMGAFLYMRNQQLIKELKHVKKEFDGGIVS